MKLTKGFRVGDRVALVRTADPFTHLQPGDEGVITFIHDEVLGVKWDSGSTLSMILSLGDRVERVFDDDLS